MNRINWYIISFTLTILILTLLQSIDSSYISSLQNSPSFNTRKTMYVGEDGEFTNITRAIAAANDGDIIKISSGTYFENLLINKSLILDGEGESTRIIGERNKTTILLNGRCTIRGLNITGLRPGWGDIGIEVLNTCIIEDCYVDQHQYGINFPWTYNTIIRNCSIKSNSRAGIHFAGANWNVISNCSFYNNTQGVSMFWNCQENIIENCIFISNTLNGVHLSDYGNIIRNCSFISNNLGIKLSNGEYNSIYNNSLINNTSWGVSCPGSHNLIYHNNFINNNQGNIQALDNGSFNNWNSTLLGNYWSDWIAPDDNNDGIVDKPYLISGTADSKDYYPITTKGFIDTDKDGFIDPIERFYKKDPTDQNSYPPDIDRDKIPDDVDQDRDGDGHPNNEDYYPDDPDRWEKEEDKEKDSTWLFITIIVIILIVIGIIGFILYRKRSIHNPPGHT